MERGRENGLLKISELAKATGTRVSTLKYYVKEGLVQPVSKTSHNMAYYHPDCVARVQLIKSLQRNHYYPLSVIKRMLTDSDADDAEIALLDVIHKADYRSSGKRYSFSEAVKMTRLSRDQVERVVDSALIRPETDGKRCTFSDTDIQVLLLIRRRIDVGIPFEESVSAFRIYLDSLQSAVQSDVDAFISSAMMVRMPSTEEAVRMITVSDDTLDSFIKMKRQELNRVYGSERLEDLTRFSRDLGAALERIADFLNETGAADDAERCRRAIATEPEENGEIALRYYHSVINSMRGKLVTSIAVCSQGHAYFCDLRVEREVWNEATILPLLLHYAWMRLAPSLLDGSDYADASESALRSVARGSRKRTPDTSIERFIETVKGIGDYHEQ